MADITGIGTSALLAFQRSLSTVGHNISNATVEGYSRQRVSLGTQTPEFTGAGYFGTGVAVNSVTRIYDQFLLDRVQVNTSSYNQSEHFFGLASQVDNLLADPDAGLSPSLQSFFNSVQNFADDPTSTPARRVLLSDSESLVQRFQAIDTRIRELGTNAERDIGNLTNEINGLANGLARVNQEIVNGIQGGGAIQPNDLLDKRDRLLNELSERISVRTVEQDDGALNVFIGNGQGLVVGVTVNKLGTVKNNFNSDRNDIVIQQGAVTVNVTNQLSGGRLGALVDFRERVYEPGLNALGRVATGLASLFNEQHKLGVDLDGLAGGDYFQVGAIGTFPAAINAGAGVLTGTLVDASNLTTSDYQVNYDGANYTVTRLSDGVGVFTGNAAALNSTPIDGFQLTIAGVPNAGDSFQVRPTRNGAQDIGLLINNAARIAAASPIRSTTAITNTGNITIDLNPITDTVSTPLGADIVLTFDPNAGGAGIPGFTVAGGPPSPILYDPATESAGVSRTLGGAYSGISFTLAGDPTAGDTLTISNNTSGVGDNSNALLLSGLQNKITLDGNNTFQSAFGELVADVGTRTRQAEITRDAQDTLLEQSIAERDAVSGVNLDEEAANLVRLQQAYQAAAQVISVSNTLFDSVLGALRR